MKKKSLALLLVMLLVMGIAMTACSGGGDDGGESEEGGEEAALTDWEYIQDKGTLIIGLDDTFAPMGFRDENDEIVGFDVDLAKALGEELGLTVEFKPIDWDAKDMELSSKNIDCIWNGCSVTPERLEAFSMSNAYMKNSIVLMSLSEDINVKSGEDLVNYKIGVQADSSAVDALEAEANYADFEANVTQYPTYDEALLDMKAGRIDIVAIDSTYGNYKSETGSDKLYTSDYSLSDEFFAVACRKEDVQTAAKINETLQTLIDNGKAEEISNKWFGTMVVINQPNE